MGAPFRKGSRPNSPRELRATLEAALERLLSAVDAVIADLDAIDGDPDLEAVCEDEGGQCDDEGADTDSEPDQFHAVPDYADDGMDQTRLASAYGVGVAVSPLGVR